jgi:hypothetical protein
MWNIPRARPLPPMEHAIFNARKRNHASSHSNNTDILLFHVELKITENCSEDGHAFQTRWPPHESKDKANDCCNTN